MEISTVTGSAGLHDLGKTLMHEHLVVSFSGWELDPNPKLSWHPAAARRTSSSAYRGG
jgi:predicted metal-dependent phosphotriesterase family hydrolase